MWLVLPDPLSTRIFFDCGIVEQLRTRLGERLQLVFLMPREQVEEWAERAEGIGLIYKEELYRADVGVVEKIRRRLDSRLDKRIGFYPLAIRLNLRHGFHLERMRPGHPNWLLDSARIGPLPNRPVINRLMMRWHFNHKRYVPGALVERLDDCAGIVVGNVQMQAVVPFIVAGRRREIPLVGYVLSWDHTVGKGVISSDLAGYIVQNATMRSDLERYHDVDPGRVTITGWPQTDVFHRRRAREEYERLLRGFELDPKRPVVLVMGNTPTNAPYEDRFVERLVAWWEKTGRERFSLLVRPHPRDQSWQERFAAARGHAGIYVQAPSYTDIETLATLLQHADCVVANAGTILLDSLVNDRPVVCVLYDEGAPPGESWAAKNVLGEHYRELAESDAFYRAHDFDELVQGIERALAHPDELAAERARVTREVVGELDGRAAERVVEAILAAVPRR